MFKFHKSENIYLSLIWYIVMYALYYCVLSSVLKAFDISVALITALSLILTINSIRKKEKKRNLDFKTALGLKWVKLDKKSIAAFVLLGAGLNFTISGILNILPSGISQSYTKSYTVIMNGNIYSTVVVMAILTPVLEEIFFRGIFQRRLTEKFGQVAGLICAACIFGLMHFNIIWSIYAAIIGFFLGCIYIYYDSIIPGAIVHCVFNLVSCVPLMVSKYEVIYRYTFGNKIYVVLTMLAGFAIIYYIVDKTWIKRFFNIEFYKIQREKEVDEDEIV